MAFRKEILTRNLSRFQTLLHLLRRNERSFLKRLDILSVNHLIHWLNKPYPKTYEIPTFSLFDGRKGRALEHVSKFLDAMGPHIGDSNLCLREFSKSLTDQAYTWYATLQPASMKTWDNMVEMFYGKFFHVEERVTLHTLHSVKQKAGERLLDFIKQFQDLVLDCYVNHEERKS
jgi:hypothetical protein